MAGMGNSEVSVVDDVVRKHYRRVDRDQPAREWRTLTLLHEEAPGLAPQPLRRGHDPWVTEMTRMPGRVVEEPWSPALATAVVDAFRRLFAVPVPPDLPLRFAPPGEFLARNRAWLGEARAQAHPDVVRRALDAAAAWHDAPPAGLDEIHDPVVAQADGNVANLLWDGQRVGLVDFEYSGVGDLAFEVADLVEHISSRLRGLLDVRRVLDGFQLSPDKRERVEQHRVVLATFWLLALLPGGIGHDQNPRESAERQAEHLLGLL